MNENKSETQNETMIVAEKTHKVMYSRFCKLYKVFGSIAIVGLASMGLGFNDFGTTVARVGAFSLGTSAAASLFMQAYPAIITRKLEKIANRLNSMFSTFSSKRELRFRLAIDSHSGEVNYCVLLDNQVLGLITTDGYLDVLVNKAGLEPGAAEAIVTYLNNSLLSVFSSIKNKDIYEANTFDIPSIDIDNMDAIYAMYGHSFLKSRDDMCFEEYFDRWNVIAILDEVEKNALFEEILALDFERRAIVLEGIYTNSIKDVEELRSLIANGKKVQKGHALAMEKKEEIK